MMRFPEFVSWSPDNFLPTVLFFFFCEELTLDSSLLLDFLEKLVSFKIFFSLCEDRGVEGKGRGHPSWRVQTSLQVMTYRNRGRGTSSPWVDKVG